MPFAGDRRSAGARTGALQHLLLAVPLRLGDGNGMIVQRGFKRPPSYHIDRLRKAPIGHFYDVITNGFGAMPDYAAQIPAARPLGDRRLHSRVAVEPERAAERRTGRRAGGETSRIDDPGNRDTGIRSNSASGAS